MVCLDTTFFADLFRKNPASERKLYELANEAENVSTTVITIAELYYGAYKSKNIIDEIKNVESVLNNFQILRDESRRRKKVRRNPEPDGKERPNNPGQRYPHWSYFFVKRGTNHNYSECKRLCQNPGA